MTEPVVRYAHGSRVPGWDDAADLDKEPAGVPDPATTPVPPEMRSEIEGHMVEETVGGHPGPGGRPAALRMVHPEGTCRRGVMRRRPAS
jgi:hypothetical protein